MTKKDEYLKFILENRNKLSNKELANKLNISVSYVTKIKRENNVPSTKDYKINFIQEQILVSGILGDGNFKKNGRYNYYYRECHSVLEEGYLTWKFNNLKPLTDNCSITFSPKRKPTQNDQKVFNTKTLKELIPYANMNKKQAITKLEDLGLVLYILDDGWKHLHNKNNDSYNINLAVHELSEDEKENLLLKYEEVLDVKGKIICSDRNTISFPKSDNVKFISVLEKYKLLGLDVVNKKF